MAVAVQVAGCAAQAHGAMLLAEEGEVGEADGTHGIDTLASVACRPALRDAMSQAAVATGRPEHIVLEEYLRRGGFRFATHDPPLQDAGKLKYGTWVEERMSPKTSPNGTVKTSPTALQKLPINVPRSASSEAFATVASKEGDDVTPRDALSAFASGLPAPPPRSGMRHTPPPVEEQVLSSDQDDQIPMEADATPLAAFAASALLRWNSKEASPEMAAAAAAFVNVSARIGQKRARETAESPERSVRAASGGFQPHLLGSDEDEGPENETVRGADSTNSSGSLMLESDHASASGDSSESESGGDEGIPTENDHGSFASLMSALEATSSRKPTKTSSTRSSRSTSAGGAGSSSSRSGTSKRQKKRKGTKRKDFSQKRFKEQAVECMEKFFIVNAYPTVEECADFIKREAASMDEKDGTRPDANRVMVWFTNRRTKYKKHHGVLPDKPEAAVKATAEKRQNARANAKKKVTQSPRKGGSSSGQL